MSSDYKAKKASNTFWKTLTKLRIERPESPRKNYTLLSKSIGPA